MTGKSRKNIVPLKKVDEDRVPPFLERRAAKALDLLCDAVSSPAAKSNGLSEDENINKIKKLKPLFNVPNYHYRYGEYTTAWNISSRQELEQVGLDLEEIGLASILSFGKSSHTTNVSDQLIPEILFTLAILDYDEDKFREFISRLDKYPRLGILLCEILTDSILLEKARVFLDRESTDQKREILLEYLKGKLLHIDTLEKRSLTFAHFASMCGKYIATVVPKEIKWISIISIKDSDAVALGTVISHSSVVKKLDLIGLNSKSIASLQDELKNSDLKICSLNTSLNNKIDEEGFHCLGNIVKKHAVEELNMSACGLSFEKLKSFYDTSGNAKIRSLNISNNQSLDEECFRCFGNIVKKHAVEELNMSTCGLSFGKLQLFNNASGNAKIRSLNISNNQNIDEEGFRLFGNIVKKHAVEELNMCTSGLSFGKLKSFNNASGNAKIRSLNISNNQDIDKNGFRCLGNSVKKHAVEELNMTECALSFGKMKSFAKASENANIRSLTISYNWDISKKGFRCLGNIVKKYKVEELNMSSCGLSFEKIKSFDGALGNAKIRSLNILYNLDIDEEGFHCLGNIVKKHAVEELNMSNCGLSFGKLKSFNDTSGNSNIRSLNIARNNDIDEEGFRCLGNIVKKHAVEELNMSDCGLSFGTMKSFDDASGNAKIKVLDISGNEDLNRIAICQLTLKVTDRLISRRTFKGWKRDDIEELQDLIHAHHPGSLRVTLYDGLPELWSESNKRPRMSKTIIVEEHSHVDGDSRQGFTYPLIHSLNISTNRGISEDGYHCLGNIVKKHAVEVFNMSKCGLSFEKLKSFDITSENAKIKVLDISDNDKNLTVNGICQLALKVAESLTAKRCRVWSEQDIRELQDFIKSHHLGGLKVRLDSDLPELRSEHTSEEYLSKSEVIEYLHTRQLLDTAGRSADSGHASSRNCSYPDDFSGGESQISTMLAMMNYTQTNLPGSGRETNNKPPQEQRKKLSALMVWFSGQERKMVQENPKMNKSEILELLVAELKLLPEEDMKLLMYEAKRRRALLMKEHPDPKYQYHHKTKTILKKDKCGGSIMPPSSVEQPAGIVPSITCTREVGPEGGRITVGDCFIEFQPGTFTKSRKVTVTARIDSSEWPEGDEVITPTLDVQSGKLQKPAKVRLSTWVAPDNGQFPNVEILHFSDNKWNIIHTQQLGLSRFIEFHSDRFSWILARIVGLFSLPISITFKPTLVIFGRTFVTALYLNDVILSTEFTNHNADIMHFNSMCLRKCDTVGISLECFSPTSGFDFVPPEPFYQSIDADILRGNIKRDSFVLQSDCNARHITIYFKAGKKEEKLKPQAIDYHWKPDTDKLKDEHSCLKPRADLEGNTAVFNGPVTIHGDAKVGSGAHIEGSSIGTFSSGTYNKKSYDSPSFVASPQGSTKLKRQRSSKIQSEHLATAMTRNHPENDDAESPDSDEEYFLALTHQEDSS